MPKLVLTGEVHNTPTRQWGFMIEGDANYALFRVMETGDSSIKVGSEVVIPGYAGLVFRGTWVVRVVLDDERFIAARGAQRPILELACPRCGGSIERALGDTRPTTVTVCEACYIKFSR